jgi:O-antigen/teichoic acid export membrane protein
VIGRDRGSAAGHPERDAEWDKQARDESPTERLDRNWGDLVQELRVVQTGVQFLTGFLLTLPFQQRFGHLTGLQIDLYLATVSSSLAATALLQTPVSVHRALFRRHQRRRAVLVAHRAAMVGILFLALAIVGVAMLIFDLVSGTGAAVAAACTVSVVLVVLWLAIPLALRRDPEAASAEITAATKRA